MNDKTKELLDEMMTYQSERKPVKYYVKMFNELGDEEIYSLNGWLLQWHKEVLLGLEDSDKLEIFDVLYQRFKSFFKLCPELKKIFVLQKDHIEWQSHLSIDEKNEIRSYINQNYSIEVRFRESKKQ